MTVIPTDLDLDALFRRQVQASPNALALQDSASSYTYQALDRKVEALSLHLCRQHGVGRDVPVGVLFSRCADYAIACLAILRAGGAYVVLELAYPAALLQDVIEDARPAVILTQTAHLTMVRAGVPTLALDDADTHAKVEADFARGEADLPPRPSVHDLDRLAFVAYSSGTTGKPKGIANPHRACVLSYNLRFQFNDVKPGDRVAINVYAVWEVRLQSSWPRLIRTDDPTTTSRRDDDLGAGRRLVRPRRPRQGPRGR